MNNGGTITKQRTGKKKQKTSHSFVSSAINL